MKQYFLEIHTYSCKNKAHEELLEFAMQFQRCLTDEKMLKEIKNQIRAKIDQANKKYTRCKDISLSCWQHREEESIAISGNFEMAVKKVERFKLSSIKSTCLQENKPAMKVIKFQVGQYHYAYAAKTEEEAKQALLEEMGSVTIDSQEEIPSEEWDKKFITIHENNDPEAEAFQASILDLMAGENPHLLFTNDWSLIS